MRARLLGGGLVVYRREEYSRREPIEDAQLAPVGGLAVAEHIGITMVLLTKRNNKFFHCSYINVHVFDMHSYIRMASVVILSTIAIKLDTISGAASCIRDTSDAARRILGNVVESFRKRCICERQQQHDRDYEATYVRGQRKRCQEGVWYHHLTEYMSPLRTSGGEY
jgi:hypothetical protein